jgi:hypothetical protein
VTALPSASHSIAVRLEVLAGGPAVSQLTTAVEPGVARVPLAIAKSKEDARRLTSMLDAHCAKATSSMLLAAAGALAGVVSEDELNAAYIMPSVFHADVHHAVAAAVRKAAGGPAELPTDTEVFL